MSGPIRTAQVRDRLVDAAIDSYIDWREQSMTTTAAYENWTDATSSQRPLAFAAYRAALDQEEHAANYYASTLRDVSRILENERLTSWRIDRAECLRRN
jgi:hypothetical protein